MQRKLSPMSSRENLVTAGDIKLLKDLKVPVPTGEHRRLTTLRQCNILDTAADEPYDRFASLCARYFKVWIICK